MEFTALGPLRVLEEGVPIEVGEPQRRLVLAMLLADLGAVVSTERLIDAIWGETPPASGRKIVQGYVSGLRTALGHDNLIESSGPGYRLNAKPSQIDALVFEELASEGASRVSIDPQRARQELEEALSLWQGQAYEDLADYDALRPEVTRLEQLRTAAIEARIAADIFCGQESAAGLHGK